jgi:hypothetical protein
MQGSLARRPLLILSFLSHRESANIAMMSGMEENMQKFSQYALVAVMLLCSACSGKSDVTNLNMQGASSQQVASINWGEAASSPNFVRPSNSFLIMMR